jgi:hypothetical protein
MTTLVRGRIVLGKITLSVSLFDFFCDRDVAGFVEFLIQRSLLQVGCSPSGLKEAACL